MLGDLVDHLTEYRSATYTNALASFLEPMLSGNTDAAYLHSVAERISVHGVDYRKLYTECYEAVKTSSRSSLDATILSGISKASKALDRLLSTTAIGNLTPVDDAIADAGEGLGKFNEDLTDSLLGRLRAMSSPEVPPLHQGVESLVSLRERSMAIAADSNALHLILDKKWLSAHLRALVLQTLPARRLFSPRPERRPAMMQSPESFVAGLEGKPLPELVAACDSLVDELSGSRRTSFQMSPDA